MRGLPLPSEPTPSDDTMPSRHFDLGNRLRSLRKTHHLTVAALSDKAGVARSTISKIENSQMSPTFDVIQKLCQGLGEDVIAFFSDEGDHAHSGRRSVTRQGEGKEYFTHRYAHQVLCTDLTRKKMFAALSTIKARRLEEFDQWVSHEGEEFFFVVSGSVLVHTELYEPLALSAGDAMYFDCSMGHATVSTSPEDAVVLWVYTP